MSEFRLPELSGRLRPRRVFQNLVVSDRCTERTGTVAHPRGNVYFRMVACPQLWTLEQPAEIKARYTVSCPRLSACPLANGETLVMGSWLWDLLCTRHWVGPKIQQRIKPKLCPEWLQSVNVLGWW